MCQGSDCVCVTFFGEHFHQWPTHFRTQIPGLRYQSSQHQPEPITETSTPDLCWGRTLKIPHLQHHTEPLGEEFPFLLHYVLATESCRWWQLWQWFPFNSTKVWPLCIWQRGRGHWNCRQRKHEAKVGWGECVWSPEEIGNRSSGGVTVSFVLLKGKRKHIRKPDCGAQEVSLWLIKRN